MIPIINGRPLETPEEFERLTPEQRQQIEANQRKLVEQVAAVTVKQQEILRAMAEDVHLVEKRFGDSPSFALSQHQSAAANPGSMNT